MDKKGILVIILCLVGLAYWEIKLAPKNTATPSQPETKAEGAPAQQQLSASSPAPSQDQPSIKPETEVGSELPAPLHIETVSSPSVNYIFTNLGGGISQAVLLNHIAEESVQVTLNQHGTFPIGALSNLPGEGADAAYTITTNTTSGEVICERTMPNQVQVTKIFSLPRSNVLPETYTTTLGVTFKNNGTKPFVMSRYYLYTGASSQIHANDRSMNTAFDWCRGGKASDISALWFEPGKIPFLGIQTSPGKTTYTANADNIAWAGVLSQYFATLISTTDKRAEDVWAQRLKIPTDNPAQPILAVEGAIGMPGFNLAPGKTYTQQFKIYTGPKDYEGLQKLGNGENEIMHYRMFGFVNISIVSRTLLWSMNRLQGIFHSYAIAIIVLTLIIKTGMWPLQNASTKSMKKMQALQPKLKEFQEKYKDDPTRLNQETMKLYKDYGVNPLSGCLPMFVQIPIFFGFYSMLGTAIELRNSKFLWVKDLSQPDTLFTISHFPVNILPLCMAGTMVWQMSLTPKSGDAAQQRMMMFIPLIFISFCYNFASALALYWTVQNLFSIAQLYLTRNQTAPVLQKLAKPRKKR